MKSCIYKGQVRHRRFSPQEHHFSYKLFLMYVDLKELPGLFDGFWLWSAARFNLAWFDRRDHVGDTRESLDKVIRDKVEASTGNRPNGPIRLLTHFRYFGLCFNPVSFYYCFDQADNQVQTIVCEVNNTPWGERHLYILDEAANQGAAGHKRYSRSKAFHVSPFMPMDIEYDWRFSPPAQQLNVHMVNYHEGSKLFDATLRLEKQPINGLNLAGVLVMYPLITVKVVVGIYFEALRLWLKKVPVYSHSAPVEDSKEAKGL